MTKLTNIFAKEENPEPEKVAVQESKPDWNGKTELTEIKKFRFTFRPFGDYYYSDKNGDLFYTHLPTEKELSELDGGEVDSLNLRMREISNPNTSPQVFYDALQEPHCLQPNERKLIKVERRKTRIFADRSGDYFSGARDKQYILVDEFSEQEGHNEAEILE